MAQTAVENSVADTLVASLRAADARREPFPNWRLTHVLPEPDAREVAAMDLPPVELNGVSGRRELHNDARAYFAGELIARFPVARRIAAAFQSPRTIQALMWLTGALLGGTYLRIEYALDLDGFWLEPHTDLGVKAFTMLLQLGQAGQEG